MKMNKNKNKLRNKNNKYNKILNNKNNIMDVKKIKFI